MSIRISIYSDHATTVFGQFNTIESAREAVAIIQPKLLHPFQAVIEKHYTAAEAIVAGVPLGTIEKII